MSLHQHAFTTNENDPAYRDVVPLQYREGGEAREMLVPKGDPLHQFRTDVEQGKLPPSWVYIEILDRQTGTRYKSNLAETSL